ncbi:hypothetical protein P8936_02210 [Edaphobacter paludis]|uniref:Uncharacterized protein n=1 Tax=Edaphobacter paludis TaxID=3035702 RepID=A0AAU7D9U7_9BACT
MSLLEGMDANLDSSNIFTNPKHAWMFVDWSPGMSTYTKDARIGTQMQYVRAYVAGSKLLAELGDAATSAKFAAHAKRVADAAIASYKNPKTQTLREHLASQYTRGPGIG